MSYMIADGTADSAGSRNIVKEQLRLFDFDDGVGPLVANNSVSEPADLEHIPTKRGRLQALLSGELDFQGEKTGYASHDLHAFAAKFPPQLPRAFICGLSRPGEVVLDPMMGSGTAIVEALLHGRYGIGLDIDPLALRLARVKTTPLEVISLRDAGYTILSRAHNLLSAQEGVTESSLANRFDARTRKFVDYWFLPATQRELMALALAIEDVSDIQVRRFLELTFSAIIVTKSGGVSLARDLAHSRPHLDKAKTPKNALDQFSVRLRKNLASMGQLAVYGTSAAPMVGDARAMPLADASIDLIVTSPPYANALDYMRAHKFSLVWFGEKIEELSKLRASYIGSERVEQRASLELPPRAESIIEELRRLDASKASILRKYFVEMREVISEMYRVLRPDAAAIVVVGTSTMRGLDVETHYCLADIAADIGFDVAGVARRNIDRDRRMMPARFGKKGDSTIEQRMHDEYVIGLLKPAGGR
jgi:DNA modification methylase